MGDSRKYPYLYHGWLFIFPKGRGRVLDYGILRAWGGIYVWKSEGIEVELNLLSRKCIVSSLKMLSLWTSIVRK